MSRAGSGVTVTGTGSVKVVPDTVLASLGVQIKAADVAAALRDATEALAALRSVLLTSGVAPSAIATAGTSTWTELHDDGAQRVVARLGLRVLIKDVAEAGPTVTAALEAAGSAAVLDGLSPQISKVEDVLARARELAFANAQRKAEQFAELSGRPLGRVLEVVDGEVSHSGGPMLARAMSMPAGGGLQVDGGEQEIGASITVRWDWAD